MYLKPNSCSSFVHQTAPVQFSLTFSQMLEPEKKTLHIQQKEETWKAMLKTTLANIELCLADMSKFIPKGYLEVIKVGKGH